MERTLSQEERIRRAEEIYYKRRNERRGIPQTTAININSKKEYKLLKKIIVQVLICVGIYAVIYGLQGKNDNFSVDSINYVKNTMSYDVNLEKYWNDIKNYLYSMNFLKEQKKEIQNSTVEEQSNIAQEENIQTNEEQEPEETVEDTSNLSQMEKDAKYIKENFSLIKPVTGEITSRFGLRNPTTPTVPKNHTGIDIAVPEGTVYVAAMEGTVELVSSQGDYRKPYKNNIWRCNDTLCTLQNNICFRRGQSYTRTANRRNRKHRKRNWATSSF